MLCCPLDGTYAKSVDSNILPSCSVDTARLAYFVVLPLEDEVPFGA